MRTTDFSPLYRSVVGFDRLAQLLESAAATEGPTGYPPYNIEQTGSNRLRIVLAVAGFAMDDLQITQEDNQLVIRGKQAEREEADYLFRGIASRQFQRVFAIEDGMEVMGASLRNGLLAIEIIRHDPVHLVRKINISTAE